MSCYCLLWIKLISGICGKRRRCYSFILSSLLLWISLYYTGIYVYFIEKDYFTEFSYPLEGDVELYASQLMKGEEPEVAPFNHYDYSLVLGSSCSNGSGVAQNIRLVFMVKSSPAHFERRKAIRQTWGWKKRFSDVIIQTFFILGFSNKEYYLQKKITEEHKMHGDILQFDFHDSYFNNTIKTMLSFKWIVTNCSSAKYVMFSDDDMYISAKNVLRFLRNPKQYPHYLQRSVLEVDFRFEMPNIDEEVEDILAGHVFFSVPHRFVFSKWYITYDEYPYSRFPPYVTAGSYIASMLTVKKLYFVSFYTKHFRFDDVYIGLVAKKARINPMHLEDVHFWKKDYDKNQYAYVISSHGYDDSAELIKVWNEQRSLGNA